MRKSPHSCRRCLAHDAGAGSRATAITPADHDRCAGSKAGLYGNRRRDFAYDIGRCVQLRQHGAVEPDAVGIRIRPVAGGQSYRFMPSVGEVGDEVAGQPGDDEVLRVQELCVGEKSRAGDREPRGFGAGIRGAGSMPVIR